MSIESILRRKTMNLFSNTWYNETTLEIENYKEKPLEDFQNDKLSDFFKTLPLNCRIYKNAIRKEIRENFEEYEKSSDKRLHIIIRDWAKQFGYIFEDGKDAKGRFFMLHLK